MAEAQHSVLLPVPNDAFVQLVKAAAPHESRVNGLWSAILYHHFKAKIDTLEFSVNPELRTKAEGGTGGFSDLVLVRNDFSKETVEGKWQIILEGKSQKGECFSKARGQLLGYAKEMSGKSHNMRCYLIAAKGINCRFWIYNKGDLIVQNPIMIKPKSGEIHYGNVLPQNEDDDMKRSFEYDLTNVKHQADILKMLEYFKDNAL
ncbi:hypothetical protein H0H92_013071 [Tricholoma furcatifolium]|nr:hypothetical protein H0H92_013071 [Tricholoma furcatifolium]